MANGNRHVNPSFHSILESMMNGTYKVDDKDQKVYEAGLRVYCKDCDYWRDDGPCVMCESEG